MSSPREEMQTKVDLVDEPRLLFGRNRACVDPRTGLLGYGPSGLDVEGGERRNIRVGVVATHSAQSHLRFFLEKLSHQIAPDVDVQWKLEFPGLGPRGPLGFDIQVDPGAVETISPKEEELALGSGERKDKILRAVELYAQKFKDLHDTVQSKPDLVLLPLSRRLLSECKNPNMKFERIRYESRTLERGALEGLTPVFDFHHVLKVLAFQRDLACQVLLPSTMSFAFEKQDAATIAWNFSAAAYYKGTGTPWKLADLDDRTCLVGITFFQDVAMGEGSVRACMAHVYMRTGESQVIRGQPFLWERGEERHPTLNHDQAHQILDGVLGLYRRQYEGKDPIRLVVHKTSPFVPSEISGFNDASAGISSVDYIHIEIEPEVRFYHEGHKYPPVRGTMIASASPSPDSPIVLYSVGYVPALASYPGSTVPVPLLLHPYRLDSSPIQACKDILALTKLDWNTTEFCGREPVTISVSRKVGEILAEMRARDVKEPPQPYRYYM